MDSDLVSDLSEEQLKKIKNTSYGEIFWKYFPFYLSIGMSPEQYWEGDSRLTIAYREAYKIQRDRINERAWLQGAYVYDAISRISPKISSFGKKGAKPEEYLKEPYPITKEQVEKREIEKQKEVMNKGKRFMEAMADASKKKWQEQNKE